MKKKQLKSLTLKRKTISKMQTNEVQGGDWKITDYRFICDLFTNFASCPSNPIQEQS